MFQKQQKQPYENKSARQMHLEEPVGSVTRQITNDIVSVGGNNQTIDEFLF